MKKRFSEEQIIGFLKQAEAGVPVKELCRQHGFSDSSFYTCGPSTAGWGVPDAKRLKELEAENGRLKKLLAEAILDAEALKADLGRKALTPQDRREAVMAMQADDDLRAPGLPSCGDLAHRFALSAERDSRHGCLGGPAR